MFVSSAGVERVLTLVGYWLGGCVCGAYSKKFTNSSLVYIRPIQLLVSTPLIIIIIVRIGEHMT